MGQCRLAVAVAEILVQVGVSPPPMNLPSGRSDDVVQIDSKRLGDAAQGLRRADSAAGLDLRYVGGLGPGLPGQALPRQPPEFPDEPYISRYIRGELREPETSLALLWYQARMDEGGRRRLIRVYLCPSVSFYGK